MKRIRLLVLAGVIAVALPFGFATAGATGSGGKPPTQIYIQATADYDAAGAAVDVGLYVLCYGGSGNVIVDLDQYPPETPYPMQFHSGSQNVVCDGQSHAVAVTVGGFGGDAGRAKVTATLTSEITRVPPRVTKASRWVTIVAV